MLRIVFYMSGILYAVDRKIDSATLRRLFDFNPVYAIAALARDAVFGVPAPKILWISAGVWAAVLFVGGFFFFKAGERSYGRI
jgi:teichoic acid transport system permease protein